MDIARMSAREPQRRRWLADLRRPPMRYRSALVAGSPTVRLASVMALVALLLVVLAGAIVAGASLLPRPTVGRVYLDRFVEVGPMVERRIAQVSVRLLDGRVLIAGGGGEGQGTTRTAELFDPATGTFTPTGSMAKGREVHTATLLDDGRVLIVGGMTTTTQSVATAEIYDPASGTFRPAGTMRNATAFHTATLLNDGRVLVVGGSPAAWTNNSTLDSAEIYDPSTGTWTTTGLLPTGLTFHAATLLRDGRVLLVGGFNGYAANIASTAIFDPATGTFSAGPAMAEGREFNTATLLQDGRVLVVGGGNDYTNLKFLSSAEVYDPATGTFSATGRLANARTYHAATLLVDGRVLVTGGYGATAPLAAAEIWDPATGTFSPAG